MLKRFSGNPIIQARDDFTWCDIKVYNAGVFRNDGVHRMLFRGVGSDWVSRLGYAESTDGVSFRLLPYPVFTPSHLWEAMGCEDPRIVRIDGEYYITYTAFDGKTARAALAKSSDLVNFRNRRLLFPHWQSNAYEGRPPDWSKAAGIIPHKINGHYYMLFGDSHIWLAESYNLSDWMPHTTPLVSSRPGYFDETYVEMGPPPMLTDKGWLVIYSGVSGHGHNMVYRMGALLLDKENPAKVIWRTNKPFLEPYESYEKVGFIDVIEGGFDTLRNMTIQDLHRLEAEERLPKAVYSCGAVMEDHQTLRLYYGAGDTVICTGTISLDDLFSH